MPIELDNTSINVINGADTFQVDFVKSKGSYTEKASDSVTYSCGEGYLGRLGHGDNSDKYTPTLIQYFITNKITISQVSAGHYYSIFLDTNGRVYSCGSGGAGRLGHGNTSSKYTPTLIENYIDSNGTSINYTNITITQINIGIHSHTLFLDTNGYVYSCGNSGLGHSDTSQKNTPTLIQTFTDSNGDTNYTNITILQISGGIAYSLFLDTNGNVYSCGSNDYGEMGHGDISDHNTPTLIENYIDSNGTSINYTNITITQISAGFEHSLFLDTNGNVYSCGYNYNGQLGHDDTSNRYTPTLIQTFTDSNGDTNYTNITITQISAGFEHSLFLDTNGNVYSCGGGEYGRLGHGDTSNKYTPTLIQTFTDSNGDTNYTNIIITQISTKNDHNIFIDTNGRVYTCGYAAYGRLGHGLDHSKSTPTLIQYFVDNNITILQVSGGGEHSIFVSNDPYYQTIEYDAQWTYSDTDASVYHLGNVGIGTYPSNTKILNVHNGINFTGDLYINDSLFDTPKYKHTHIRKNNYLPDIVPNISPTYIPNSNEYQIYSFVYDDSNNNGNGQTEYTINFYQETECDILIVGGGGAGGGGDDGAGGGAGGLVLINNITLNGEYKILVGKGGVGDTSEDNDTENGKDTIFNIYGTDGVDSFIAVGGGGGGVGNNSSNDLRDGNNGGSGGGASGEYASRFGGISTQNQYIYNEIQRGYGNKGGDNPNTSDTKGSAGGGGAGFPGTDSNSTTQGVPGGDGLAIINSINLKTHFNINNTTIGHHINDEVYFAGGGGGGNGNDVSRADNSGGKGGGGQGATSGSGRSGTNALINSGGGGGGAQYTSSTKGKGGDGGSGIVIIRCKIVTSNLNIPTLSSGVITELNKFDQYNTLTFNYDDKYLRHDYYPELSTSSASSTFSDTTNLIAWYKFNVIYSDAKLTNYGNGGTIYEPTLKRVHNGSSWGVERIRALTEREWYTGYYDWRYRWNGDAAPGNYLTVDGSILQSLHENGHTISFWAFDESVSDSDYTIIATNSIGEGTDIYIRIYSPSNDNNIYYDIGDGSGNYSRLSGASGISDNELVFWTFTRENISSTQMMLKIYKNGALLLQSTSTRYDFTNASSSSVFYIGYNASGEFKFQNKSLEDFRIYNRPLTHEEIEKLHIHYTDNKIHARYKFDYYDNLNDLTYDTGTDYYRFHATLFGTPQHILPYTISFNVGDGSQYLLFPTDVIKDNGITHEQLTFSIWVNKQESNTGYAAYFGIDNDTDADLSKTIFFGQSGVGATYIHVRYGYSTININTIFDNRAINVWNHYVLVLRKDGSNANIKCYVNGIEYTAFNSNIAWLELDDYMKINKWQTGILNDNISKYIRDFRVYKAALSGTQVRYIYKSSLPTNNQSKYTLQFDRDTECDFLIVAGGGGGCGNNNDLAGGGGGAGELLEKYNITLTANAQYTIIVGNGGKGQPNKYAPAIEGFDSGIYIGDGNPLYHTKGGGRGGNGYYAGELIFDATSGGSGGGAGMISSGNNNVNGLSIKYNSDGRGHDGKVHNNIDAGGGGGAGSTGWYKSNIKGESASIAGKGYTSYITGEPVTYASGGYGGWQYNNDNTANAGKGSGGKGYGNPQGGYSSGSDGTDGIVIIKYKYLTATSVSEITYTMNSWTYTDDGNVYYMGNVGIGSSSPTERLDVDGTISAITKSFKIKHPLNNNISLYHGNIECPRYDNIYRGRATIVGGTCIVDIDKECNDTGGLIEGTFEALNTDSQLYLQNNQTFDNVKGTIENGKIHIECENTDDEITINWIVIAERKDVDVVNLNTTNNAGKLICEHFK